MKTVFGDLVRLAQEGRFDVIVHGCNCQHVMGGGVALAIRNAFPKAYVADLATNRGDENKLGTCSVAECPIPNTDGHQFVTVVNAYTQFDFGRPGQNVDYTAVMHCMEWVRKHYNGLRIGIPKIGAGLAGGSWDVISDIIELELGDGDLTLVLYRR